MIVTLKLLAQGIIVDFIDEYVRNEESTTTKSLKQFIEPMVSIYFDEYLEV